MAQTPGDATARPHSRGVNGNPQDLAVERAIGELRRGRAVAIEQGKHAVVVCSAETLTGSTLEALAGLSRDTLTLALSARRARAMQFAIDAEQAMAVRLPPGADLAHVAALAGLGGDLPTNPGPAVPCDEALCAAVHLCVQARLLPAVVAVQVSGLGDPSVLRVPMAEAARFQAQSRDHLERVAQARVPLRDEEDCELILFRDLRTDREHLAVRVGRVDPSEVVTVRVHSACLTGDVLASLRCDCGEQLRSAVQRMSDRGGGVLLYMDQEGRGIGLANKLRAYALQDTGLDTFEADERLGFGDDERSFVEASEILRQLGISRITLLTNNPQKLDELSREGIDVVSREALSGSRNRYNSRYLEAKRNRGGHLSDE